MPNDAAVVTGFARARVPLGFLCGIVALVLAAPTRTSLLAGGTVALIGELLRVWAAGHLVKSSEVTTSGPYRWFAHPLYVGSSVIGLGIGIASGRLVVAVLVVVYLIATIGAAVHYEEAFLRTRFGPRYDRYRQGGARGEETSGEGARRFSFARAVSNREYRAIAGWIVAALLLWLKATYNGAF